ncbi:hypothetical protein ACFL50_05345 [Candidatus Latescibacterota bacterium]
MLKLLSTPLYLFDLLIVAGSLVLILILMLLIIRQKDSVILASLEKKVNLILPLGLVIQFIAILEIFQRFYIGTTSIMTSGTGDPRILVVGVIQEFLPLFLFLLFGITILLAWFVLWSVIRKKIANL